MSFAIDRKSSSSSELMASVHTPGELGMEREEDLDCFESESDFAEESDQDAPVSPKFRIALLQDIDKGSSCEDVCQRENSSGGGDAGVEISACKSSKLANTSARDTTCQNSAENTSASKINSRSPQASDEEVEMLAKKSPTKEKIDERNTNVATKRSHKSEASLETTDSATKRLHAEKRSSVTTTTGANEKVSRDRVFAEALKAFCDEKGPKKLSFMATLTDGTTEESLRTIHGLEITSFVPELEGRIPPRAVISIDAATLQELERKHQGECFADLRPMRRYLKIAA
jgi:superfamily II DNA helicase RecQ